MNRIVVLVDEPTGQSVGLAGKKPGSQRNKSALLPHFTVTDHHGSGIAAKQPN
jgi:hypothetical protein